MISNLKFLIVDFLLFLCPVIKGQISSVFQNHGELIAPIIRIQDIEGTDGITNQVMGRKLLAMMVCSAMNCPAPRACVSINGGAAVCQCPDGRSFNALTMLCEGPVAILYIRIHLITIRFTAGLESASSPEFQLLQQAFISNIYLILITDATASGVILDIYILRFLQGSVIVEAQIYLKENSNVTAEYIKGVIEKGLRNPPPSATLNFTNARLDDIYEEDACDSKTFQICGPNAICISRNKKFTECRCQRGYENILARDDPSTKDVQCEAICEPQHCNNRGFCEYGGDGEKACNCEITYLGMNCQYNGITILLGLIGTIAALIFIVILVLAILSKRGYSLADRWCPFKFDSRYIWPFAFKNPKEDDMDKDTFSIKS